MSEDNEGGPNVGGPFDDVPVVYGYRRAQALADGVLVDVSAQAAQAGFRLPVAVTAALWIRYVVPADTLRDSGQSEAGRLHDVLTLLRCAIGRLRAAGQPSDRVTFRAAFVMPPDRSVTIRLVAIGGPGTGSPPCGNTPTASRSSEPAPTPAAKSAGIQSCVYVVTRAAVRRGPHGFTAVRRASRGRRTFVCPNRVPLVPVTPRLEGGPS